jgi:hypothetical protein
MALGVAARPDAAGQRGEVFGAEHHRRAVDQAGPDDDPVGGDLATDHRAELTERARVEQVVDARPRIELALVAVFGQPLRTAHRPRALTAAVEVVERLLPVGGLRH